MNTEQSKHPMPAILIFLIFLGMLTLLPWGICTLFVFAFSFDAPGSTRDHAVLLTLLVCCSYPLFLILCPAFLAKYIYNKKGKLLFPVLLASFPTVLCFSLFALMIYAIIPDYLDLASFPKKIDKKFIKTCAYKNPDTLKKYLNNGSDPNLTSSSGMNPLLASYIGRNIENFETLLNNGADPNLIPGKDLGMNVAGFILWRRTEDWKKDGVPYIKMLFKYRLNPKLKSKYGSLVEFAYKAREKEYLKIFKGHDVDFSFTGESKLAQAIIFERWEFALYEIKKAKTKEILGAVKYLEKNIREKNKLAPEEETNRQKLIDEYKKRNISTEDFIKTDKKKLKK